MQTTTVRVLDRTITLELTPTPFAHVLDKPGQVAMLVYEFPVEGSSNQDWDLWCRSTADAGPRIEWADSNEHLVLPFLSADAAEDVAMHSYFSGAPLLVSAMVRAHRGEDALHDFADTQNVYGMPGAPDVPEDELRFLGSGL